MIIVVTFELLLTKDLLNMELTQYYLLTLETIYVYVHDDKELEINE